MSNALHISSLKLLTRIVIYYAPNIFQSLGLTSSTISLLATGVLGFINVGTTIPAISVIDKVGRKPLMIAGSVGMALCHITVGVIVATCSHDWKAHVAAGWVAVGKLFHVFSTVTRLTSTQQSLSGSTSSTLPTPGAQAPGFSLRKSFPSPSELRELPSGPLQTG